MNYVNSLFIVTEGEHRGKQGICIKTVDEVKDGVSELKILILEIFGKRHNFYPQQVNLLLDTSVMINNAVLSGEMSYKEVRERLAKHGDGPNKYIEAAAKQKQKTEKT